MNKETLLHDLKRTGEFMGNNKLVWGTAGNISARLDDNQFYVSASGTYLSEITEEEFSLCDENGLVEGMKPSKEHIMHQGIYENRPEINAILHSSPFYSTLVANSDIELPSNYFVEAMYYLERVVRVPYYHPGSRELAEAVKEKSEEGNILLLENHGIIVYDTNLKEARMALETLEYTSKMHITALQNGINMQGLSDDKVEGFLKNSGYKPVREWPE